MDIIQIRNLNFTYKLENQNLKVLNNINISIKKGDFVAIQGPSGSGKSTFLYLIGGLLGPDSGKIIIEGQDITKFNDLDKALFRNKTIGFVFQQFHLLSNTSVLDNILLPTIYPKEIHNNNIDKNKKQKAIDIARKLGLEQHLDHHPNQLSGGQQQRVAIARALMNDSKIILADEPTGNLDSKNTGQIMELFRELNNEGKTIIIITHENDITKKCNKVYNILDGKIKDQTTPDNIEVEPYKSRSLKFIRYINYLKFFFSHFSIAYSNLRTHYVRSFLTTIGIVIGVCAVLSMVTMGEFVKDKILASYEQLGVNTLSIRGWKNWQLKASDNPPMVFSGFKVDRDIKGLSTIFPQVLSYTPLYRAWSQNIEYGGNSMNDVVTVGVNENFLTITDKKLSYGNSLSYLHVQNSSNVCVIGTEIVKKIYKNVYPIGKILNLKGMRKSTYNCKIIGVLEEQKELDRWTDPNKMVFIPFTYYEHVINANWLLRMNNFLISIKTGTNIEETGNDIKAYFEYKFGKSGLFDVDSNTLLVAQMRKFLSLFTILLAVIALVSLLVGGIGIANMMLVSVSERFREIGIRKAFGATSSSIRTQFLLESIILCSFGGLCGVFMGFSIYELIIYAASKLTNKVTFEWVFEPWAFTISVISIITVGIASGIIPAIKAEKLDVISALRSE